MKVNVINKSSNSLPVYAKAGDSGMDVMADFSKGVNEKFMHHTAYDEIRQKILVFPGGRVLVPTGIFTSFPPGYEIQVRSRSGLALKQGVFVLNSPGTIDSKNIKKIIGVLKQGELLESLEVDNQQPSLSSNTFEGSETNVRILTDKAEDSNNDTSALLQQIKNIVGDDIVRTIL